MKILGRKFLFALAIFSVLMSFLASASDALIQDHLDYGGCSMCHTFHSGTPGTPLLAALYVESICLSCHGEMNPFVATVVSVHNPMGKTASEQGYITCRECHDAHEYDGTPNIKAIGYLCDPETQYGCDNGPAMTGTPPFLRVETNSTILASPVYCTVTFVYNTAPLADFNIDNTFPGPGACQICHSPHHNQGNNCTTCHPHNGGFLPSGVGCVGCHDGTDSNAPIVTYNSPHSKNTIFPATDPDEFDCVDCHKAHGEGTVEIPNYNAVGINYTDNSELGISLGNPDGDPPVIGSTEAEICWNCHDDYGVSEWGLNTDTNLGAANYNFGSMVSGNSNWLVGNWQSARPEFAYKTEAIQSTHSVNDTDGVSGVDAVEDIRCSYCHDVHDTRAGSPDGAPYLRGTWMGNPYREDGAPQSGTVYSQYEWGPVPRGSILNNEYGGYQIDQNNGNPTSSWTANGSAGLCAICHGTDPDGSWTSDEIDTLNQVGDPSTDWIGANGHSNAVLGGGSTVEANIFYTSDRAPGGVDTLGAKPDMGYSNHGSIEGYGFRGTDGRSFLHTPAMDASQASNSSRPYGGSFYEWGATVNEGTTDTQYHKFSCSKCHNPHASRLPRLMITNCLDTKHNTWDENAGDGGPSIANSNWEGITLGVTTAPDSWGRTWSNTTSAQNCHRLAGDNRGSPNPGYGSGWNNVTPW